MIDARIAPFQQAALRPLAQRLADRGVRADWLTLAGFALGVLAVPALALGHWGLALGLILANRAMDGLDGAVARIHGPTDRGAFLDIALDFLFYALVPLGFALHDPATHALPAAVLIASFVGTGASFLAFALIAERRGIPPSPSKGIRYLGGLTEGAETIALFVAACLVPAAFPLLALIFAAACALTALARIATGWTTFSTRKDP